MAGECSKLTPAGDDVEQVEPISVRRCCHHPHEPCQAAGDGQVSYQECRRNHAISFGRYAFDGCGEFMSSADNALICAACGCHRNFHRRQPAATNHGNKNASQPADQAQGQGQGPVVLPKPTPSATPSATPTATPTREQQQRQLLAPMPLASHNEVTGQTSLFARVLDRNINNIDAGSETIMSGAGAGAGADIEGKQKRRIRGKRTTLTLDQKREMTRLAIKFGWRPQRQDDAEIQEFCEEIGITKRVFMVWLNNNRRRRNTLPM